MPALPFGLEHGFGAQLVDAFSFQRLGFSEGNSGQQGPFQGELTNQKRAVLEGEPMPVLVGFDSFGAVHAEATSLESMWDRWIVSEGTSIGQIHPHHRVTSQGKCLGVTVSTPSHRDIGRAPEGVQNLALFISGRRCGGINRAVAFKDEIMEAQLREKESHGGLENMGVQISANDDLVPRSQPC